MLILGIHSDWQDAGVAFFDDYQPLAAVPLSRVTGVPRDGGSLPLDAIAECLAIAGRRLADVEAVVVSAGILPSRYVKGLSLSRRLGRSLRALIGRDAPINLADETHRTERGNLGDLIDAGALLGDLGLNRNLPIRFYLPQMSEALIPLSCFSGAEALVFTIAAAPGQPAYRSRLLKFGRLADVDSGDAREAGLGQLVALAVEGLGLPDEAALVALAPYGEPILAQALMAHIAIDAGGRISTDFSKEGGAAQWLKRLAEGHAPEIVAASLVKAVEETLVPALDRQMTRFETRRLVLGGALLCQPCLLHRLAMRLGPQELTASPACDYAWPIGGILQFLLERDGMAAWLAGRRDWSRIATGRDFAADIDPVLGNGGCRLVSQDSMRAAAALLNAGKVVAFYDGQSSGCDGGTGRMILFAADQAGRAGEVNSRLDRPDFMPPLICATERDGADWLTEPGSAIVPFGNSNVIAGKLNPVLRGRLAAILSPDAFCQIRVVSRDGDPLLADLLDSYAALSKLPALLALPMQIGGEPRLDTPRDALRLLMERRVDYLATENAVWERG